MVCRAQSKWVSETGLKSTTSACVPTGSYFLCGPSWSSAGPGGIE